MPVESNSPLPPLLRLCELPNDNTSSGQKIRDALVDLAIATTSMRRAHRVYKEEAQKIEYFCHYTKEETFNILFPADGSLGHARDPSPRLLLSPTELLNDPNEGNHFFSILSKGLNSTEKLVHGLMDYRSKVRIYGGLRHSDPLVFTASLCMEKDNLNLWRFYGNAKGVSFGVHYSKFDCEEEEGITNDYRNDKLYRVKYGDAEVLTALNHIAPSLKKISSLYEDASSQKDGAPKRNVCDDIERAVNAILNTVAYLFKTDSYASEKECRLLRVQSIDELYNKSLPAKSKKLTREPPRINGFTRIESNTEFIHDGEEPPIITLGPQFDGANPERGQTLVLDRVHYKLPGRMPIVRLSDMKYRIL